MMSAPIEGRGSTTTSVQPAQVYQPDYDQREYNWGTGTPAA